MRRLRNAPIRTDRIIGGLVGLLLLTGMACDRSAPADSGGATPPGPGESRTVQLPNGARMDFAWIEPGTFVMGTSDEQAQGLRSKGLWEDWFENEQPAHEVTIRQGFWLGQCEITQGQWERVMGTRPWADQEYVLAHPDHPAVFLSWEEVQAFIHVLNAAAGDSLYRLPTEAEWEYACRAGTNALWPFGEDKGQVGTYAWYGGNACSEGACYARAVATKRPNGWGLYDMSGNVGEWCQDRYGAYSGERQVDPPGPGVGVNRVLRGGFFSNSVQFVRPAYRGNNPPDVRRRYIGARLVKIL